MSSPNRINNENLRNQLALVQEYLPGLHSRLMTNFPGFTAPALTERDRAEDESDLMFEDRQIAVDDQNARVLADQEVWLAEHGERLDQCVTEAMKQRTAKGKGKAAEKGKAIDLSKVTPLRPKPKQATNRPMAAPPPPTTTPAAERPAQKRGRSDTVTDDQPRKKANSSLSSRVDSSASRPPTALLKRPQPPKGGSKKGGKVADTRRKVNPSEGILQDTPCAYCYKTNRLCYRTAEDAPCLTCRSRKSGCKDLTPEDVLEPRKPRARRPTKKEVSLPDVSDNEGNTSRRSAQNNLHHDVRLTNLILLTMVGALDLEDLQPWADDHVTSYREWSDKHDPTWRERRKTALSLMADRAAKKAAKRAAPSTQTTEPMEEAPPSPPVAGPSQSRKTSGGSGDVVMQDDSDLDFHDWTLGEEAEHRASQEADEQEFEADEDQQDQLDNKEER